jgi:hypothetical protein
MKRLTTTIFKMFGAFSELRALTFYLLEGQWHTQEFCSGGIQQIQLRTEGRENGDLGAVAP